MKARDLFRAPKKVKIRDEEAGATPLRDADAALIKDLGKDALKQRDRDKTAELAAEIATLQEMLYAQRKHKLLIVLQGMDTSGKDGTVSALFKDINPMGLNAVAFKAPTPVELAHDFLWRVHQHVPAWGEITIFNRSHYEDVLITLVQKMIDEKEGKRRYQHINDFERMLTETGTVIVKIFLHISKDEQRKRLQARIDDPDKQWKFDPNDVVQRERWDDYQRAYEAAISATDCDSAPWYIVPADSKPQRDLAIASLLLEILQELKLTYPAPNPALSGMKIV